VPVVLNRGVGDAERLFQDGGDVTIDAGLLSRADLDRAARALAGLHVTPPLRERARQLARRHFDLEAVGIARYRALYERLASRAPR
jgi:hypothetical protein